jgi:hypothetical protein
MNFLGLERSDVARRLLQDLINRLSNKTSYLGYEAQKLTLERNYRDECILKETMGFTKVSRQNFVLKVNLQDLKEANVRSKVSIDELIT